MYRASDSDFTEYNLYPEVTTDVQKSNRYFHSTKHNRSTEVQNPLLGHFFTLHTTAVQKQYTFQWIPHLISLNITYVPRSRRTCRSQTNTFIVQDSNASTEIQYLFGGVHHFQNHSCEEIVYFLMDSTPDFTNITYIPKSLRTCKCQTDTFIVQDWNPITEIQYPFLRHFFTFNTAAVKR